MKNQKIYAFIDSQNLNLGVKNQGWTLDFAKFRIYLKDKYNVEKAFLFIGYLAGNEALYQKLQLADYILVFKPILKVRNAKKVKIKGNVDAELVLHTMIQYRKYNKALIVTGDGDFHCLVEYLLKKRKFERLIVPNYHRYSALLRNFAKDIDFMNGLRKKLAEKNKKRGINLRTKP